MPEVPSARFDKVLALTIFTASGLVFLPTIHWLTAQTIANEQLLHAFIVFAFTGFLIVLEKGISFRPVLRFSRLSQNLLIASYALLLLAVFSRFNLAVLGALSLCLVAFLLFLFGSERQRLIFASVGAFCLFTAFAALLPVLDWPLRSLAGQATMEALRLMGHEANLGLMSRASEPMLMLVHEGRPYHVAAECNGFGMLTSALLMASILALYRRAAVWKRLLWIPSAVALALVMNTLRIILIVLIAPHIPDERYMLMHEAVGILTTYGGLALLYLLLAPKKV